MPQADAIWMPKARLSKQAEAATATWCLYILRCADGSLYTGITTDLTRRTEQHNAGTASRYTRSRRPVRVAYQEPVVSRSLALKRESAIKSMPRAEKESLVHQTARLG